MGRCAAITAAVAVALAALLVLALGVRSACALLPVGWAGRQAGLASWFGLGFHGRRTATGTALDAMEVCRTEVTAASRGVSCAEFTHQRRARRA